MKLKNILLSFISIISLSACGSSLKKEQVFTVSSSDTCYEVVNNTSLGRMIDSKMSFILFVSSSTCTSCMQTSGVLENYHNEYNTLFYKYEYSKTLFEVLKDKYSDFNKIAGTPSLAIFKEGKLTYNFQPYTLRDIETFTLIAGQHFVESDYQYATKLTTIENQNCCNVVFYNSSTLENLNKIHEIYKPIKKNEADFATIFVDEKSAEQNIFDNFCSSYSYSYSEANHNVIFSIIDGEISEYNQY